MALLNKAELQGLPIAQAYWRIISINWGIAEEDKILSVIGAYASKEARDAEMGHFIAIQIVLDADEELEMCNPNLLDTVKTAVYTKAKELPMFTDAVDA
jgi:hypothetical protein